MMLIKIVMKIAATNLVAYKYNIYIYISIQLHTTNTRTFDGNNKNI